VYVAAALELRDSDRGRLEVLTRAPTVRSGLATRARIVLLAAEGVANTEIADRTGTSRDTSLVFSARNSRFSLRFVGFITRRRTPNIHYGPQTYHVRTLIAGTERLLQKEGHYRQDCIANRDICVSR